METMSLLEQDNDKDDILLKKTGNLVKREKTQNQNKTSPNSFPKLKNNPNH